MCCSETRIKTKSLHPRPRYAVEAQELVVVAAAGLWVERAVDHAGSESEVASRRESSEEH